MIDVGSKLFIDTQSQRLVLKRESKTPTLNTERNIPLIACSKVNLHIFVDASSIEVFVNDGEYSLTSNFYPTNRDSKFSFYTNNGKARVSAAEFWKLSNIYSNC